MFDHSRWWRWTVPKCRICKRQQVSTALLRNHNFRYSSPAVHSPWRFQSRSAFTYSEQWPRLLWTTTSSKQGGLAVRPKPEEIVVCIVKLVFQMYRARFVGTVGSDWLTRTKKEHIHRRPPAIRITVCLPPPHPPLLPMNLIHNHNYPPCSCLGCHQVILVTV